MVVQCTSFFRVRTSGVFPPARKLTKYAFLRCSPPLLVWLVYLPSVHLEKQIILLHIGFYSKQPRTPGQRGILRVGQQKTASFRYLSF